MRVLRRSSFISRIDNYYRRNQDKLSQDRDYRQLIYFNQRQECLNFSRIRKLL